MEWKLGRKLGEGSFGNVFLGTHQKDGTEVSLMIPSNGKTQYHSCGLPGENESHHTILWSCCCSPLTFLLLFLPFRSVPSSI